MITIITPTNNVSRLLLTEISVRKQTEDCEWLVCSKEDPKNSSRWIPDDFAGGFWTLNRAYNKLIKEAEGDIIISLQDNIWIPPDGARKFRMAIEETGGIVSGVGDQYSRLNEDTKKPEVRVWKDPRKTDRYGTFYECIWNDVEFNWAAFPKEMAYKVGGFDETLDFKGYGGDQLSFCERLNYIGAHFFIDQTNESYTLRHGRRKGWDKNHTLFNGEYDKRKEQLIKQGDWQHLHYLERVV